ncbi:MAG: glycosyltransferase [candidate division KSB1 bacterium]|nr:glycosyltransferase [candidate division KSB1 bacterium]MDZ7365430.1 glycosyltransferase [candidate division KSB1 bacterium]MDZ7403523.1 glycosyltransferase [candidate division KSB1 bacterium]
MSRLITAWAVPTCDRPLDLKRLLECYLRQTLKPDKVIVVDGSHDNKTQQLCQSFKTSVKNLIYHRARERGLVAQRMQAFEELHEVDYVLFLDDDFELHEKAFEILCAVASRMPARVAFELNFKTLLYGLEAKRAEDGALLGLIKKIFLLPHQAAVKKVLPSGANTWLHEYALQEGDALLEVVWLSGCCMFLPVKMLEENLSFYFNKALQRWGGYSLGEDVYLSIRLKQSGCKNYRVMAAHGIHHKVFPARADEENLLAAKIHNYFLVNRALGRKIKYRVAYQWSLLGYFGVALIKTLSQRSLLPLRGFKRGLCSLVSTKS